MVATVQRKNVLAGMLTAVLGVAIALPFTLIHPILPFLVVLLGFILIRLMRRWRWIPKYPSAYWVGGLTALLLLLPASSLVKFAEQGFMDGPFYGAAYEEDMAGATASNRLDYRQGELIIYNREAEMAPILAYQIGDEVQWAQVLDVSENPRYQGYQLSAAAEPELAYGILRDRLDFLGTWSFGAEPGKAYFWKWGGFHRFFLSW